MSQAERLRRVRSRIRLAGELLDSAIEFYISTAGRELAAVCILYSGGNDSTTLAHMFRKRASHVIHVNTGIGIEATRSFVRETTRGWGLPLIEESPPPGSTYEELVLSQGFPGPAHHWKMYQRLKERGLRQAQRKLVTNPHKERIIFLAGRRRDESIRRFNVPAIERVGSVVWVSPLVNWTALDLNTYRLLHPDVPKNPVTDALHMSGECLCGAFAHKDELEEIAFWYPEVAEHIRDLEEKVRKAGHPEERCRWGWGAYRNDTNPSKVGVMCSSCKAR